MNTPDRPSNYSWGEYDFSKKDIQVLDTSLRDGLQDSQIRHPNLEEKEHLVDLLVQAGVDAIDVAIPIARGSHLRDAIQLARRIPSNINVVCLARTDVNDIQAAVDLAQGAGRQIETIVFCGASPLRRWVEEWNVSEITRWMAESVSFANKEGLLSTVATEHTTQTEPEVLKQIYLAGLDNGGKKLCIADTSGAANPVSTANIIRFFRDDVLKGFEYVDVDWHGHNDRGLSVINSLVALASGARRVHGTVIGIGERAGNTPLEQILINLKMGGDPKRQNLQAINELATFASAIFNTPLPSNYPGLGEKVYITASGIHAAAELKARQLGLRGITPYSAVNPEWVNRETDVVVGPLSGSRNVRFVAERLGIPITDNLINRSLDFAKSANRILTDQDIKNIADSLTYEEFYDRKS